jgi:hypothetical protein
MEAVMLQPSLDPTVTAVEVALSGQLQPPAALTTLEESTVPSVQEDTSGKAAYKCRIYNCPTNFQKSLGTCRNNRQFLGRNLTKLLQEYGGYAECNTRRVRQLD